MIPPNNNVEKRTDVSIDFRHGTSQRVDKCNVTCVGGKSNVGEGIATPKRVHTDGRNGGWYGDCVERWTFIESNVVNGRN